MEKTDKEESTNFGHVIGYSHAIYAMCACTTELRKNISIDQKTWERLKSYGSMGDSFDSLLNRLMDIIDKTEKSKK